MSELIKSEHDPSLVPSVPQSNGAMSIATTRSAQEVQAAMVVAKNFPRDETASLQRILRSCKRKGLAEDAMYEYPRGGQKITGPSIRLAEALAQGWGNMTYGVIELSQKPGESSVMAYAWDMETNTRRDMVFTVSHMRHTKQGSYLLTDPRDIYEMVANNGARRVRACILGIIPGDVVDLAIAECEKTLKLGNETPLADRIRSMVIAFAELSVTKQMLEGRLGHPVEVCSEAQFASLRKVYSSIKDGIGAREDFFTVGEDSADKGKGGSRADSAAKKLKGGKKDSPPPDDDSSDEPPPREPGDEPDDEPAPQRSSSKGQQSLMSAEDLQEQCEAVLSFDDIKRLRGVVKSTSMSDQQRNGLTLILDKHERRLQQSQQD